MLHVTQDDLKSSNEMSEAEASLMSLSEERGKLDQAGILPSPLHSPCTRKTTPDFTRISDKILVQDNTESPGM